MADIHKIYPSPTPKAVITTIPPPTPRRHLGRYIFHTLLVLIVVVLLLIGVFIAIIFLYFHPKIPHYSITTLHVTSLSLSSTTSSASLTVNVTAHNPNKHIGIYYDSGSLLTVSLINSSLDLCSGSLPVFFQGHRNTTVMLVPLSGSVGNSTKLAAEMMAVRMESGVPLGISGVVPVRLKMGYFKLVKMVFKATCRVVVTRFSADSVIRIKKSSCKIKLKKFLGISF